MSAAAAMAFLHHLAAFTLVAAIAAEVTLVRAPLSLGEARRLLRIDTHVGIAALALLVIGLARVQYFEKGPAYYWHDVYFLIKFAAFLLAALISVYPTLTFLALRRAVARGAAPAVSEARLRRVRQCLIAELAAIAVILFAAALMARGFGYHP